MPGESAGTLAAPRRKQTSASAEASFRNGDTWHWSRRWGSFSRRQPLRVHEKWQRVWKKMKEKMVMAKLIIIDRVLLSCIVDYLRSGLKMCPWQRAKNVFTLLSTYLSTDLSTHQSNWLGETTAFELFFFVSPTQELQVDSTFRKCHVIQSVRIRIFCFGGGEADKFRLPPSKKKKNLSRIIVPEQVNRSG